MPKNFTITLSDEEVKALDTDMISIQEWIDNAIHEKTRRVIDRICEKESDKNIKKMSKEEKLKIIRETKLKTVKEKNEQKQ